jgi:hypothetical protein
MFQALAGLILPRFPVVLIPQLLVNTNNFLRNYKGLVSNEVTRITQAYRT